MAQSQQQRQKQRRKAQPLVAWRALQRLIADPEQTHEVFNVVRALSGPALYNGHARLTASAEGRALLARPVELVATLQNRPALAQMPAGSLGRAYLNFVTREGITADGLVEASEGQDTYGDLDEGVARYGRRLRDQHDLWHTLTGYGRDTLGEACLLGFSYAQTRNRGIGVIALVGAIKLAREYGRGAYRAIWRGYRDGRRAAWLPGQDWEHLLAEPLDALRQRLGLREPRAYHEVRAGLIATA